MSDSSIHDQVEDLRLPAYEQYEDSLVAFVDVLGFDNDARSIQSQEDFLRIAALLFAFRETAAAFARDGSFFKRLEMTTMSDSVVVSMPYDDPICAMGLIFVLLRTQYDVLATSHRRLLRGFLTHGRLYHRNGVIFGEAYSNAYEHEKQVGHAPRIVIDPLVVEDARMKIAAHNEEEKRGHIFNYLRQDPSDGLYFIDYLNPRCNGGFSVDQLAEERRGIGDFIRSSLARYETDLRIRRKYEWLRWYLSVSENAYRPSAARSGSAKE